MVVLSAGTLATPQILQRSGIGDPSKLLRVGISDIVAELPGVGLNLHEHPYQRAAISFVDVQSSDTADDLFRLDPESLAQLQEEFEKEGGGPLAGNFADVGMKYRPTEEEIKTMGPEWEDVWKEYFAPNPDRPLMMILLLNV
jgi:alcohol oxidase